MKAVLFFIMTAIAALLALICANVAIGLLLLDGPTLALALVWGGSALLCAELAAVAFCAGQDARDAPKREARAAYRRACLSARVRGVVMPGLPGVNEVAGEVEA